MAPVSNFSSPLSQLLLTVSFLFLRGTNIFTFSPEQLPTYCSKEPSVSITIPSLQTAWILIRTAVCSSVWESWIIKTVLSSYLMNSAGFISFFLFFFVIGSFKLGFLISFWSFFFPTLCVSKTKLLSLQVLTLYFSIIKCSGTVILSLCFLRSQSAAN